MGIIAFLGNNWVASIITLISIIITALTLWGKRKKPVFVCYSKPIITNKETSFNSLKVLFDNREVENLTESILFFWNKGRDAIRQSDILEDNPIRLEFPEGTKLYRINYQRTSNMLKTFNITRDKHNVLLLNFDSMLYKEGICFRILHSGNESSCEKITINGTLPNKERVKKIRYGRIDQPGFLNIFVYFAISVLVMIGVLFFLFILFILITQFSIQTLCLGIGCSAVIFYMIICGIKEEVKGFSANVPMELIDLINSGTLLKVDLNE